MIAFDMQVYVSLEMHLHIQVSQNCGEKILGHPV